MVRHKKKLSWIKRHKIATVLIIILIGLIILGICYFFAWLYASVIIKALTWWS